MCHPYAPRAHQPSSVDWCCDSVIDTVGQTCRMQFQATLKRPALKESQTRDRKARPSFYVQVSVQHIRFLWKQTI